MVGLWTPREKARELIEALDFFEVVAAMRASRPGQNGKRERQARSKRCDGDVSVGIETQDPGNAAGGDTQ